MAKILIVEDEQDISSFLKHGLSKEGHGVDLAANGEDGESFATSLNYDLIILDIILPLKNGLEVCRSLRSHLLNVPILILSCKNSLEDKIAGLDAGADDYLTKPFVFQEFSSRVRALLRRRELFVPCVLRCGSLSLNKSTREVKLGEKQLDIKGKDLELLMSHPKMIHQRVNIEQNIWSLETGNNQNILDVYISKLRAKLDGGYKESWIETLKGTGYRLRAQ